MISLVAFLFIFAIVVLVHEFGHYGAAKAFGVRVFAFGLGFGPKIWSYKKNHTEYSLNAIPLGGFVKIAGLDDQDNKDNNYPESESYLSKKIWQKMLIIAAGPLMNLALAVIIIALFFIFVGMRGPTTAVIEKVMPNMPASASGLLPGDKIVQVNDYVLGDMDAAIKIINASKGNDLEFLINRNGDIKKYVFKAILDTKIDRYIIGINLASGTNIRYNPLVSLKLSLVETYHIVTLVLVGLVAFFTGHVSMDQVAGPVGIAQLSGQVAKDGMQSLFRFLAFLSINLGILNLIPFPALDGGRIFFLLLESVLGKNIITVKRENYVHYFGFVILIVFILFVTYQDLLRIFK